MVINIAALKDGDDDFVEADIRGVVEAAKGKALVKVIIETCLLTDEEKSGLAAWLLLPVPTLSKLQPGSQPAERQRKISPSCGKQSDPTSVSKHPEAFEQKRTLKA